VAATTVVATGVAATGVAATGVAATGVAATDVAATSARGVALVFEAAVAGTVATVAATAGAAGTVGAAAALDEDECEGSTPSCGSFVSGGASFTLDEDGVRSVPFSLPPLLPLLLPLLLLPPSTYQPGHRRTTSFGRPTGAAVTFCAAAISAVSVHPDTQCFPSGAMPLSRLARHSA
jgi:hypothetical protein